MKVSVDPEACIGSGQCVRRVPAVFDQSDEGTVLLLQTEPDTDQFDAVREAAHICPSSAIEVAD